MEIKKILKLINAITNSSERIEAQSFIFTLQEKIIDLQSKVAELKTENSRLKVEIQENLEWEKSKSLYKPYQTRGNSIVYVKTEPGEFKEFFCPSCFLSKIIVHLQPSSVRGKKMCPKCQNLFITEPYDNDW